MEKYNIKKAPKIKENTGYIADNSNFIEAFRALKADPTDVTRVRFAAEFGKARLLIPVVIEPEPVNDVIQPGSSFTFFMLETAAKVKYLITFTSVEELNKWDNKEKKQVLSYDFDSLHRLLQERATIYDGIIIDPKGDNFAIKNDFMKSLTELMNNMVTITPERLPTDSETPLEEAKNVSEELKKAVKDYCISNRVINGAYIMQTVRKGNSEPTIIVVLDFDAGEDMRSVFDGLARAVRPALKNGESIGMMPSFDKVAAQYIKGVEMI